VGYQLRVREIHACYSPLPPPVMTTVRPFAEKRSEGLIGFEVSMIAVRGEKIYVVVFGKASIEYRSTLKDHSLVCCG
jgi:hypothetical protein